MFLFGDFVITIPRVHQASQLKIPFLVQDQVQDQVRNQDKVHYQVQDLVKDLGLDQVGAKSWTKIIEIRSKLMHMA